MSRYSTPDKSGVEEHPLGRPSFGTVTRYQSPGAFWLSCWRRSPRCW